MIMKDEFDSKGRALAASGSKLATDIAEVATDAGAFARDFGERNFDKAKEALSGAHVALADRAWRAEDAARGYVRRNSWQALGVAALGGLILGLVIARS
jgi:ElaB/YqjD/DUF883 family membrane-anchored ribosome-binding protein